MEAMALIKPQEVAPTIAARLENRKKDIEKDLRAAQAAAKALEQTPEIADLIELPRSAFTDKPDEPVTIQVARLIQKLSLELTIVIDAQEAMQKNEEAAIFLNLVARALYVSKDN